MIAFEEMRLEALRQPRHEPLDYAATVGTAIDIIAKEDERARARLGRPGIVLDLAEQRIEQIGAAVDVAHGIDQLAFWNGWDH